ncbi:MAG: response regulator [Planctomycetota bacterium]|nr:MAG: response regulator [Planctomycetota bacterium]REJ91851.1 MAG: response regulator [Planctomycetota bacterium]REK25238.1 MAG: response regulator [Planctomycetota bacterium]REK34669.1 MAG: response regulator [Planctomycetota bacterium]
MDSNVPQRPKALLFGSQPAELNAVSEQLREQCDVIVAENIAEVLTRLTPEDVGALSEIDGRLSPAEFLLEAGGVLQQLPDGLALLDVDSRVLWSNRRLMELAQREVNPVGELFLDAFANAEILGPDFCPVHTALGSGETARSTLKLAEHAYVQVDIAPVPDPTQDFPKYLIAVARDVSDAVLQRQKLNAVYQAGLELGDLQPQDVLEMSMEERVELLKSKILHYTQDVLKFDTVEIRLLERETGLLDPLLQVGMEDDAASRDLYASAEGNGVTGFVAATGRSYLCEDTMKDPLYLPGAPNARSSLTVPLVLHNEVLGTFNVESPRGGAFNENDLQFLELFCREVAIALNTLNLLVAEKATTAAASTERMLCEIASPVDEILNDAAWILERYIGHDEQVASRLQQILLHTREIRERIQEQGESMRPELTRAGLEEKSSHPGLRSKRILVADSDRSVRRAAHELLGRYGCVVETAHNGEEALLMARTFHYDTVIADIRLPDMNGADCFQRIRETHEHLPVILMTGFGYDSTHSIVKARQMGLEAVLYKPFRLDQLLTAVDKAVQGPGNRDNGRG